MPSKHRITAEILRAGQPKAYADTETVARVTFEMTAWNDPTGPLLPWYRPEDQVLEDLPHLRCGFSANLPTARERAHGLDRYLDYLKPVDPKTADEIIPGGDPNQRLASVWEFRVVTPFTD